MRITPKPLCMGLGFSAVMLAAVFAGTASAHDIFYSGRAVGLEGEVTIGPTTNRVLLADNYMSCRGKPKEETVHSFFNPRPYISTKTVTTYTLGRDDVAQAQAALADYEFRFPPDSEDLVIKAKVVESYAEARCTGDTVRPSGHSTLVSLTINGEGVEISGDPNQTIPLPGGQLVINEQQTFQYKRAAEMRVTGLHLTLGDKEQGLHADVRVSHTRAKAQCEPST